MKALDLFCGGAGGWSLGLHRAGFTTVAACEIDPWRREVFSRNFPEAKVYDDVRTLSAEALARDGIAPEIIVGSPPCKEFSSVGRRRGLAADALFLEAVRLVAECRPGWCAFENSPHLRTRGADRVLDALDEAGYACWPLVVGAGNAGASHRRARVWIVGADAARIEGRAPGLAWVGADRPGGARRAGHPEARPHDRHGASGGVAAHADRDDVRLEPWRSGWSDGGEAGLARLSGVFFGPVGSRPLGEHLRAYNGLPAGLAERCRAAYGDAVVPIVPELIGRAILAVAGPVE
jgi:DNA (cytosine-5)-methyltransferase 1